MVPVFWVYWNGCIVYQICVKWSTNISASGFFLHCALAVAQCIVIGPVCLCVCVFVCLWVCYHDNSKSVHRFDPHQTGFIGKQSDHLQLIKVWPPRAAGRGSAAGWNFWLRSASAQCLRLLRALFSFLLFFLHGSWSDGTKQTKCSACALRASSCQKHNMWQMSLHWTANGCFFRLVSRQSAFCVSAHASILCYSANMHAVSYRSR